MVLVSTEFKARSQVIYIHQHHSRLGKTNYLDVGYGTELPPGCVSLVSAV